MASYNLVTFPQFPQYPQCGHVSGSSKNKWGIEKIKKRIEIKQTKKMIAEP